MQLGIVCCDPLERLVLERAAARRAWETTSSTAVYSFSEFDCPDAVVVDAECLDEVVLADLAVLSALVADRPVFVLAERAEDVPPELESLCTLTVQLKPFYPAAFLEMVQSAL